MADELAADHGDVRIDLVAALVFPAVARVAFGVVGVGSAVAADEAHAAGNRLQQRLLALRRHGRLAVLAFLFAQITLRLEQESIELSEVLIDKHAAVFLALHFEAVFGAQVRDNLLGE